jgi:hypothetical protein
VKRLLPWARSILLGWAALLAIAFGVETPFLHFTRDLFGPPWIATVHLTLDCGALAAAGWAAGRSNRAQAVWSAALFAVTLSFWDFGEALALNVPWLGRVAVDSFHDLRYLDALLLSAETHALMFGCLLAGAMLSRPREEPISLR